MKLTTNNRQQNQFQQVLLGISTILIFTPLAQPLSAQALPIRQPTQIAMDNCIMSVATTSDTYIINVCQKPDKTAEMVLENRKTGEKLSLPAIQIDDSGNVFSASLTKRERITTKLSPFLKNIPMYVPQTTTYILDISKKQLSITKEINTLGNSRKSVQFEKLGYVLMSSNSHITIA
jgi:hypothetical protein